jgi:hypothetical protein
VRRRSLPAPLVAAVLAAALVATPAHALKVVTWNLLAYPSAGLAARQPLFRTVIANLDPDVLMVQEMVAQTGVDSFLTNVLNVVEPGQWAVSNNVITTTESVIFYKPAKVSLSLVSAVPTGGPRDALLALVTPVGYNAISAKFRIYSVHFKAGGPGTPDSTTRRLEATSLRNTMNLAAANTNILVGGDMNLYGAYEGAYIRLTESQADNDGRMKDVLTMPGDWHVIPSYALYDTQCPCNTGCQAFFSGGGMDDRFDLILSSYSMQDGQGVDLASVAPAYYAYGNDGQHFNDDINGGARNSAVPLAVANALKDASDHLPVVFIVQLAAKVAAASQVDFGSAITGGLAQQTLAVSNGASVSADALDYSFAAPSGFTAPGGPFSAAAGAAPNSHTLGMSTAGTGVKTGTLVMTTDDRDSLTKNVLLSGRVLAHAVPSLDSLATVTQQTLDFGTHETSAFPDLAFRVHDRGYSSLQARLSLDAASFPGAPSRFSIVGGFTPGLLAGIGRTFTVRFDAAGATPDSTYDDTLVVSTSDEPLPGATALASLAIRVSAHTSGTVTVEPGAPATLRFLPPRPNPLRRETRFAFDLPRAGEVALEVFDLSGRRIATVARGDYPAGSHEERWSAVDEQGAPLGAGLYFARLSAGGRTFVQRLAVLP